MARLSNVAPCIAKLDVVQGGKTIDDECFGNKRAALGVTWIGDDIAVQIGYDLLDNTSGDWQTRG